MIEVVERIRQACGTIEVLDGDLRVKTPKGLLTSAERSFLAEHKAEIVRLLAETPVENATSTIEPDSGRDLDQNNGDPWEAAVDPPPPCQQCGSLELWQDFGGKWHCQHCQAEGLERSERLVEKAARFRRRASTARLTEQRKGKTVTFVNGIGHG